MIINVGDLIRYSPHEYNDRLGTHGIVLHVMGHVKPTMVEVLWNTKEIERVFSDELEIINE